MGVVERTVYPTHVVDEGNESCYTFRVQHRSSLIKVTERSYEAFCERHGYHA